MLRPFSPLLIPLVAAGLCAAADSTFADGLYPVLQKSNCRTCHVDGGIASATRLLFPEPGAPTGQIEAFGRSLAALVNRDQPQASLLFTKPTNREKHTGGKLISPGSPEEALLLDWVRQLARLAPAPILTAKTTAKPAQVVMRRLTHSQYNHTVRDLLGDQTQPAKQFPP